MRTTILYGSRCLSTSGVTDYPSDVTVHLGVAHGESETGKGIAFVQRPVFKAIAYLRSDTDKHVIADIGILAIGDLRNGGGTHTVKTLTGTVLGRIVAAIFRQSLRG